MPITNFDFSGDEDTPRDLTPIDSVCSVCLVDVEIEDHQGWCPKA